MKTKNVLFTVLFVLTGLVISFELHAADGPDVLNSVSDNSLALPGSQSNVVDLDDVDDIDLYEPDSEVVEDLGPETPNVKERPIVSEDLIADGIEADDLEDMSDLADASMSMTEAAAPSPVAAMPEENTKKLTNEAVKEESGLSGELGHDSELVTDKQVEEVSAMKAPEEVLSTEVLVDDVAQEDVEKSNNQAMQLEPELSEEFSSDSEPVVASPVEEVSVQSPVVSSVNVDVPSDTEPTDQEEEFDDELNDEEDDEEYLFEEESEDDIKEFEVAESEDDEDESDIKEFLNHEQLNILLQDDE